MNLTFALSLAALATFSLSTMGCSSTITPFGPGSQSGIADDAKTLFDCMNSRETKSATWTQKSWKFCGGDNPRGPDALVYRHYPAGGAALAEVVKEVKADAVKMDRLVHKHTEQHTLAGEAVEYLHFTDKLGAKAHEEVWVARTSDHHFVYCEVRLQEGGDRTESRRDCPKMMAAMIRAIR